VAEHCPDILVISAHGTITGNAAALYIGDEPHLDLGIDRMPPVVMLSACHVAPRGSGAVAITDLLLREGAMAVLGTQVPVDATRNATLMARFMTYLAEEIARPGQFATVLDAWHHVQTTNAVNDILSGSPSLRSWAVSAAPNGNPVITEFMSIRAGGRIRKTHVYARLPMSKARVTAYATGSVGPATSLSHCSTYSQATPTASTSPRWSSRRNKHARGGSYWGFHGAAGGR
jgi:hypothetical protein